MDKQTEIKMLRELGESDTSFSRFFGKEDVWKMCENIINDLPIELGCSFTSKPDFKAEKEARDRRIYEEFISLISEPGLTVTQVTESLMRKYKIHSPSTLWAIRKRVEKKLRRSNHEKDSCRGY